MSSSSTLQLSGIYKVFENFRKLSDKIDRTPRTCVVNLSFQMNRILALPIQRTNARLVPGTHSMAFFVIQWPQPDSAKPPLTEWKSQGLVPTSTLYSKIDYYAEKATQKWEAMNNVSPLIWKSIEVNRHDSNSPRPGIGRNGCTSREINCWTESMQTSGSSKKFHIQPLKWISSCPPRFHSRASKSALPR